MELFPDCAGRCHLCACENGCLAGNGDDDFWPATKEQLIKRLDKGDYREYRDDIINHLKIKYDYDYILEKNLRSRPIIEKINLSFPEIKHEPNEIGDTVTKIVSRYMVESNKKLNEVMCGKIKEVCAANGINVIYLLNEEKIIDTMTKQLVPKAPVKGHICPTCGEMLTAHYDLSEIKHCPFCGQLIER